MAQLVSAGVDVQIIDESFYASAGAGTIPLIVLATAANKVSPSGSGYAPYTAPDKAGTLLLASSQRDLIQSYGNPKFHSIQGTQLHGHELNEYGLLGAYHYLGISNRAYTIRADIDLGQLEASVSAPRGAPVAGTYWFDLSTTSFGVFQSNGNTLPGAAWEVQRVRPCTLLDSVVVDNKYVPKPSFGNDGDFAVVVVTADNRLYEKQDGAWTEVGSTAWKSLRPTTVVGQTSPATVAAGAAFAINGIEILVSDGSLPGIVSAIAAASIPNVTATILNNAIKITGSTGVSLSFANKTGTPLTTLGLPSGVVKAVGIVRTNSAQYPSGSVAGDVWVKGASPNNGAKWSIKYYNVGLNQFVSLTAPLFPFTSTLNDGDAAKDLAAFAGLGVPTTGVVYVGYDVASGVQEIRRWSGSRWETLVYEASIEQPSTAPEAGTLWYNPDFRVDIMVGDGNTWTGYRRRYPSTDPLGVILSGSQPVLQSDGSPLVDNDLWINTTDLENYPALYRYTAATQRWKRIDNSDQTTPFGIVFADARADSGVAFDAMPNRGGYAYNSERISDMLVSDYLDPDAPDPRTHPDGVLLFNTRYSTYNVKVWRPTYFADGGYDPNTHFGQEAYTLGDPNYVFQPLASIGRWVTASGNQLDGSPYMGRKAQRIMVVRAMAAVLASNENLRSELYYFNLMAAPGYPELIDEMVNLNTDQKEVSFIVADTPCRLSPRATDLQNWALNPKAMPNGEAGLSTRNPYVGVYYPWGLSTNLDGTEVMVPPSTIALRTMAYNDQVAYPWFAPAGYTRGLVTNASTVGYLSSEGEFVPTILNQGQRDTLYLNKINPIAFIPNRGLVVLGQKTLHSLDSALDRINVARLCNYLKFNLDNLMKPFLFEQNDQQTRDSAKLTTERFLAGLITLRALEDFGVVCDEQNNTPERRDRNELWVDIIIKPIKAIEFIYVPVRIRSSAASMTL